MLHKMSDKELILKTKNLVNSERELLIEILNHLKEIDFRKLYLELGFSSLWAYCTEELGYSEAAAHRRIEAMRAIRELPILVQKIEAGSLSISNIAKAQSLIRRSEKNNTSNLMKTKVKPATLEQKLDQKLNLFLELENKSQKQAEVILAGHFPEQIVVQEKVRVLTESVSEIKLAVSKELIEKLDKVKRLVAHKNPNPTYAELIELMADFVIAKKDLSTKVKTAEPKTSKATEPSNCLNSNTTGTTQPVQSKAKLNNINPSTKNLPSQRKYIPKSIRRSVWLKANGRCEFTSSFSGKRCNSQHQLEIDHKNPVAFGGGNSPENLQLLCRSHNMHAAEQATLL